MQMRTRGDTGAPDVAGIGRDLRLKQYYIKHYHGSEKEIARKRKYSFSDRSRYYFANERVQNSISVLFDNLHEGVPYDLLSQYMPIQYRKVREGLVINDPKELVLDRIDNTIDDYIYATHQKEL